MIRVLAADFCDQNRQAAQKKNSSFRCLHPLSMLYVPSWELTNISSPVWHKIESMILRLSRWFRGRVQYIFIPPEDRSHPSRGLPSPRALFRRPERPWKFWPLTVINSPVEKLSATPGSTNLGGTTVGLMTVITKEKTTQGWKKKQKTARHPFMMAF